MTTKQSLVLLLAGVGLLSALLTLAGVKSKLSTNDVDNSIKVHQPRAQGSARIELAQGRLNGDSNPIYEVRIELSKEVTSPDAKGVSKDLVFEGFLLSDSQPQWNYRDYFMASEDGGERHQLWVQCLEECNRLVAVLYDMSQSIEDQIGTAFYFMTDKNGQLATRNMDLNYLVTTADQMTLDRAVQLFPSLKDRGIF